MNEQTSRKGGREGKTEKPEVLGRAPCGPTASTRQSNAGAHPPCPPHRPQPSGVQGSTRKPNSGSFKTQGCGKSSKQLPQGELRPPNADIICGATDPGERLGSGGCRRRTQASAGRSGKHGPAQTQLLSVQPPPLQPLPLPGNARPVGVGRAHSRGTRGSCCPCPCLLQPSGHSPPHSSLPRVTAPWQRIECSCLVPRHRPEQS